MSAAKRRHSCVTVRSCSRMMRSMRSAGVARMSQNENIPALLITTSTTIPSAVMRSYNSCAAPTRARSIAITRTSGVTAAVALLPHSFPLPTPCCALPAASAPFRPFQPGFPPVASAIAAAGSRPGAPLPSADAATPSPSATFDFLATSDPSAASGSFAAAFLARPAGHSVSLPPRLRAARRCCRRSPAGSPAPPAAGRNSVRCPIRLPSPAPMRFPAPLRRVPSGGLAARLRASRLPAGVPPCAAAPAVSLFRLRFSMCSMLTAVWPVLPVSCVAARRNACSISCPPSTSARCSSCGGRSRCVSRRRPRGACLRTPGR